VSFYFKLPITETDVCFKIGRVGWKSLRFTKFPIDVVRDEVKPVPKTRAKE
jgi:hypothetical protein